MVVSCLVASGVEFERGFTTERRRPSQRVLRASRERQAEGIRCRMRNPYVCTVAGHHGVTADRALGAARAAWGIRE